jgi:hypothetical protein
VDFGDNLVWRRDNHSFGEWIEVDLESAEWLPIAPALVRRSIAVCSDVIEHLVNPMPALSLIRQPGEFLDCHRCRTLRILLGNALKETSSQGSREQREPPEAGKAVSRPKVKTLLSAGRNDPVWWSNAPPAGPRHRA